MHGNDVMPVKIAHSEKKGCELHAELSKMLAIREKMNIKKQRCAQDYNKIQTAGSQ